MSADRVTMRELELEPAVERWSVESMWQWVRDMGGAFIDEVDIRTERSLGDAGRVWFVVQRRRSGDEASQK